MIRERFGVELPAGPGFDFSCEIAARELIIRSPTRLANDNSFRQRRELDKLDISMLFEICGACRCGAATMDHLAIVHGSIGRARRTDWPIFGINRDYRLLKSFVTGSA